MAQKHLRKIDRIVKRLEECEHELYDAIMEARESGETLRDIGARAGLTPQRIHQITRKGEARQNEGAK